MNKDILSFSCSYDKETELYRKAIRIYSIVSDKKLADKQIEALIMYIRYGYSRETKEVIKKELKFKSENYIHVMNFKLKQQGMLVDDKYNRTKKHISQEIKNIKNFVESNKSKKILPLIFNTSNEKVI